MHADYTDFIFPAYGISALLIFGLIAATLIRARSIRKRLAKAQGET